MSFSGDDSYLSVNCNNYDAQYYYFPTHSTQQITDESLLETMNRTPKVLNHEHYESRAQKKFLSDNTLARNCFRLRHYAGYVVYSINSFLDKNRDILYFVRSVYIWHCLFMIGILLIISIM